MILYITTLTSPLHVTKDAVITEDTYYVTWGGLRFYKDTLLEVGYKPLHKAYLSKEALQADRANILNQIALRTIVNQLNVHSLSNDDTVAMLNLLKDYGRQRRRNGVLQNTKGRPPRKALAIHPNVEAMRRELLLHGVRGDKT